MNQKDKTTEEKILDAANKIFVEKGLDGTRMQEIADEAKMNKSLLHYYYRSKEKLFSEVFNRVIKTFLPNTIKIFDTDKSLFEKIEIFVSEYISLLEKNPFIPMFVLHELSKKPTKIADTFSEFFSSLKNNQLEKIKTQIQIEIQKGTIRPIGVEQIIVNILSLCIFPFAAKPIIAKLFFDDDKKNYKNFIEERKTEVADFVIQSIRIKN
ncbi:MAG: TetR/AcrR family transcriptional regulator [Bacteroidales bacterium]|nr:TetR/AcrR family transcriptional regulator [Bacteroidales bacterium]